MESRLDYIKQRLSRKHNETETLLDWGRGESRHVYVNGQKAFSGEEIAALSANSNASQHSSNKEIIQSVIRRSFFKTDERILDHILKFANQHDFLTASEHATAAACMGRKKIIHKPRIPYSFTETKKRYDFIENDDGTVTYIERFYIDNYCDERNIEGTKKSAVADQPIAIVVTESIFSVRDNQIHHELASDKILLVDPIAENLFTQNDGVLIKKYQTAAAQIESELYDEIANYNVYLQRIKHIQFAVSYYANFKEVEEINRLLNHLSKFLQNLCDLRTKLADHEYDQLSEVKQDELCLEIDIYLKLISNHLALAKRKAEHSPGGALLELIAISSKASKFNTKIPESIRPKVDEPNVPEQFGDFIDKHYKAVVVSTVTSAIAGMGIGVELG